MASSRRHLSIHPALEPYVVEIWVDARDAESVPEPYRVLPSAAPVLGFQFSGRLSVRRDDRVQELGRSGITGIQSTARWFLPEAATRSVLVRLAPYGGYALFGQSMQELADRHIALDEIVNGTAAIEDRLGSLDACAAAGWVQRWLLERLAARHRGVHADVVAAASRIAASGGRERIEAMANSIGVSRRRLERLFLLQIGVSPKEHASLVRFGEVVRRLGSVLESRIESRISPASTGKLEMRADRKSWTDIALDAGYADQAHFIRDFKRRAGMTPTEFGRL